MIKEIIGIDLGQSGAIVKRVFENGIELADELKICKMPDTAEDKVTCFASLTVLAEIYIEDLHAMPESFRGTIPNFASGYNKGVVEGILYARGHLLENIHWVAAQTRQRKLAIPSKKSLNFEQAQYYQYKKRYLKELAIKIFPNEKVVLWSCDALLISEYGINEERKNGTL